ncbi:MAG: acyl-CoA dehydrogenase [Rhodospirillales bacterium]|jgi:3-methylfumaryl-CoA hydratase|nr:acyl-CoA dehydrogenase [Rhodospirillales bacterium]
MEQPANAYTPWIGRTETLADVISPAPAIAAAAMFDLAGVGFEDGAALPPLWHWFYFLPKVAQAELGEDGHPAKGGAGFMPPIPLPRRMFAGARLQFHSALTIGQPAVRSAEILSVSEKAGKSGTLAFVTVRYAFHQNERLCIEEWQDIVYREAATEAVPAPVPADWPPLPGGAWAQTVVPDSRLLFRFSALTFNAHRIHYDRAYAMAVERYPGLVVHGPLTAMLLMEMVRARARQPVVGYSFRGLAPLFDLAPFRLVGRPENGSVALEAQGPDGRAAMTATATLG